MAAQLPAQISLFNEAERTEHVPEVDPGSLDRDTNLHRLEGSRRKRLDLRFVKYSALVWGQYPVRIVRQGQSLGRGVGSYQTRNSSTPGAVGDVIFRVWVQQFIHKVGRLSRCTGVKVNHSRLQMGSFQGHYLAHAPEDRAGKLTRALALQYLRPARDEPYALLRYHIGIGHALHQRKRACTDASYVLRHFCGGCLCSVTTQRFEVHDAVERHVVGQALDQ